MSPCLIMAQLQIVWIVCFMPYVYSHELKYALFTAGPSGSFDSSGVVPAIELAEELINADSSILPGYNLTHTPVVDTMCDRTVSLDEYFMTTSPLRPTILSLLGCGCSDASGPVAEIIHYRSLSQISYASSSPDLSDRRRFPNLFRTYNTDTIFPEAMVTLLQFYDWRRIVFLTQDESLFIETQETVTVALKAFGAQVEARLLSEDFDPSDIPNIPNFFYEDGDYRVFFLNTYSNIALQIICEASQRGYTYPRYVWLTYGWYQDRWWTDEAETITECSDEELANILHRSLAVSQLLSSSDTVTDTKLVPEQFNLLYQDRLREQGENFTNTFLAPVAFDALWTLALALNSTSEMVHSLTREEILSTTQCEGIVGELVPLENFSYSNQLMGCIIRWNLERTDFVGVSGRVSFDSLGSRVDPELQIYQYRLHIDDIITQVPVAHIITEQMNGSFLMYNDNESNNTVYPSSEGGVPPDGTPVTVVVTFHLALVVTFYLLAAAGLVYSTVCLIFNYTQRKKKVVQLNSPNLNYLIIIGSYIVNVSVFFRVMPSTDSAINAARCNLGTLLNTIGYCLAYGVVLAKMGRTYYILNNKTTARKVVRDWHLLVAALVVTAVGTLLSVLQVTIPSFRPEPFEAPNDEIVSVSMNEYGLSIKEMVILCYDVNRSAANIWIIIVSCYLVLLQLIGIVLALQLQKIKLRQLEDSRFIIAAIFISSISLGIILVSFFAIGNLPNLIEFLISGSLMFSITVFLSMVFIPKMVSLYRDPDGECVFDSSRDFTQNMDTTTIKTNPSTVIYLENPTRISQLESKISILEGAIRACQEQRRELTGPAHSIEDGAVIREDLNISPEDIEVTGKSAYVGPKKGPVVKR